MSRPPAGFRDAPTQENQAAPLARVQTAGSDTSPGLKTNSFLLEQRARGRHFFYYFFFLHLLAQTGRQIRQFLLTSTFSERKNGRFLHFLFPLHDIPRCFSICLSLNRSTSANSRTSQNTSVDPVTPNWTSSRHQITSTSTFSYSY